MTENITENPGGKELRTISVGIGESRVSRDPAAELTAYGLGSCVCVCAYDPNERVAGMAHILLPGSKTGKDDGKAIYADTAIRNMIRGMRKRGAEDKRIVAKISGGACVLKTSTTSFNNIGMRNVCEVRKILARREIPIVREDVGGTKSRTVRFAVETGEMTVSSISAKTKHISRKQP